jgi:hypothetical protein
MADDLKMKCTEPVDNVAIVSQLLLQQAGKLANRAQLRTAREIIAITKGRRYIRGQHSHRPHFIADVRTGRSTPAARHYNQSTGRRAVFIRG